MGQPPRGEIEAGIGEDGEDPLREVIAERAHVRIAGAAQHDRGARRAGPARPENRSGEPRRAARSDEALEVAATRRDVTPRVGRECANRADACQTTAE